MINDGDNLRFDYNSAHAQTLYRFLYNANQLPTSTYLEKYPKNLNNTSAIINVNTPSAFNDNTNFVETEITFNDLYNGTIILSGILSGGTFPIIYKKINFENCSCNIIIKDLKFDNCTYKFNDYFNTKGFNHISNLNFINCPNVYLENVQFQGQNYTSEQIKNNTNGTSTWYNPYLYTEESQKTILLDSIFSYNSNLRINKIAFTDSAIGIYATVNSNVSIYGQIDYHANTAYMTFLKRQILAFATKNSIINIQTITNYENIKYINNLDLNKNPVSGLYLNLQFNDSLSTFTRITTCM